MQLAQLNIAKAIESLESPLLKEFVDNLEAMNSLAENSAGFVWRLKDEDGNATGIQAFDDPQLIVNMSVWDSADALKNYVFKTEHVYFLQKKAHWFEKLEDVSNVLWWIPDGHIPSLEEARAKLQYLSDHGESPLAFGFRSKYQPSDVNDLVAADDLS